MVTSELTILCLVTWNHEQSTHVTNEEVEGVWKRGFPCYPVAALEASLRVDFSVIQDLGLNTLPDSETKQFSLKEGFNCNYENRRLQKRRGGRKEGTKDSFAKHLLVQCLLTVGHAERLRCQIEGPCFQRLKDLCWLVKWCAQVSLQNSNGIKTSFGNSTQTHFLSPLTST